MKRLLLTNCLLAMFVLAFGVVHAQERTVSGRITSSEDGSAIPGVNVILKGTTEGVVTDVDGKYTIAVPTAGGTLVFTFIGLQSQELEIGTRTVIDVPMATDVTQLSEVI